MRHGSMTVRSRVDRLAGDAECSLLAGRGGFVVQWKSGHGNFFRKEMH
jgi:hypothetical protein